MGFDVRPGGSTWCNRLMRSAEKGDWRFGMEGKKPDRVTRRISLLIDFFLPTTTTLRRQAFVA